ncbi:hypothetical protein PsorP6_006412 [Peronosclerospora sorghi]|uniref:Uncharacterized protein n=1 Tax=Peronosclerospora sorghi TaxID=230839 RepID=A0ACC0W3B6_9STRA|nr:hypothetical protein PsorP6_006412 [Peronosclerospora sorghi]
MLRLCHVHGQACGPRIRKDWDMLTPAEKTTYRNAVSAAMDSGAYIKFVEIHLEMRSEHEAHRQCMLIYWHRMMLLAFENMLRDQRPAFACVTVPYFNWIAASARMTSGACTSFQDCSAIMRELGGSTSGRVRRLTINGAITRGRCVDRPPLNHFCQRSSVSGSQCDQCVPRGDWTATRIPVVTSYASVRAQVFNGVNIGQMSPLLERGCHNGVHSALRGAMSTLA